MKLSEKEFERIIVQALDDMPKWVEERVDNLAIILSPYPTLQQLRAAKKGQGRALLGLYEGIPLSRRGRGYGLVSPDRITLFQETLEYYAHDEGDLVRLVRKTIIHEIGHHFGLSEGRLSELGC